MFRMNNCKQARRGLMVVSFASRITNLSDCDCDLGPARAYTLRGKYRQFLLRVSADNVDEFISSNVIIQPDRTLDIVVEMVWLPEIMFKVLFSDDYIPLASPSWRSAGST